MSVHRPCMQMCEIPLPDFVSTDWSSSTGGSWRAGRLRVMAISPQGRMGRVHDKDKVDLPQMPDSGKSYCRTSFHLWRPWHASLVFGDWSSRCAGCDGTRWLLAAVAIRKMYTVYGIRYTYYFNWSFWILRRCTRRYFWEQLMLPETKIASWKDTINFQALWWLLVVSMGYDKPTSEPWGQTGAQVLRQAARCRRLQRWVQLSWRSRWERSLQASSERRGPGRWNQMGRHCDIHL